jgi:hypothetical protein
MRACIMVDGHWRTKGVSVMSEASEVYGREIVNMASFRT